MVIESITEERRQTLALTPRLTNDRDSTLPPSQSAFRTLELQGRLLGPITEVGDTISLGNYDNAKRRLYNIIEHLGPIPDDQDSKDNTICTPRLPFPAGFLAGMA